MEYIAHLWALYSRVFRSLVQFVMVWTGVTKINQQAVGPPDQNHLSPPRHLHRQGRKLGKNILDFFSSSLCGYHHSWTSIEQNKNVQKTNDENKMFYQKYLSFKDLVFPITWTSQLSKIINQWKVLEKTNVFFILNDLVCRSYVLFTKAEEIQ